MLDTTAGYCKHTMENNGKMNIEPSRLPSETVADLGRCRCGEHSHPRTDRAHVAEDVQNAHDICVILFGCFILCRLIH